MLKQNLGISKKQIIFVGFNDYHRFLHNCLSSQLELDNKVLKYHEIFYGKLNLERFVRLSKILFVILVRAECTYIPHICSLKMFMISLLSKKVNLYDDGVSYINDTEIEQPLIRNVINYTYGSSGFKVKGYRDILKLSFFDTFASPTKFLKEHLHQKRQFVRLRCVNNLFPKETPSLLFIDSPNFTEEDSKLKLIAKDISDLGKNLKSRIISFHPNGQRSKLADLLMLDNFETLQSNLLEELKTHTYQIVIGIHSTGLLAALFLNHKNIYFISCNDKDIKLKRHYQSLGFHKICY